MHNSAGTQHFTLKRQPLSKQTTSLVEIVLSISSVILIVIMCYLIYDSESSGKLSPNYRKLNNILYREQVDHQSTVLFIHVAKKAHYGKLSAKEKKAHESKDEYYEWLLRTELLDFTKLG